MKSTDISPVGRALRTVLKEVKKSETNKKGVIKKKNRELSLSVATERGGSYEPSLSYTKRDERLEISG